MDLKGLSVLTEPCLLCARYAQTRADNSLTSVQQRKRTTVFSKKKTLCRCRNEGLALRPLSFLFSSPTATPATCIFAQTKYYKTMVFFWNAPTTHCRGFSQQPWAQGDWQPVGLSLLTPWPPLSDVFLFRTREIFEQFLHNTLNIHSKGSHVPPSSSHSSERIAPIRSEGPSFVRQGAQIEPNMFLVATRYPDPAVWAQEEPPSLLIGKVHGRKQCVQCFSAPSPKKVWEWKS